MTKRKSSGSNQSKKVNGSSNDDKNNQKEETEKATNGEASNGSRTVNTATATTVDAAVSTSENITATATTRAAPAVVSSKNKPVSTTTTTTGTTTTTVTTKKKLESSNDLCLLPDEEDDAEQDEALQTFQLEQKKLNWIQLIPIVIPICAYFSYETIAQFAHSLGDLLASRSFVEVDGGSYRASIIAPAINGIVVPACVVTFATLLSISISFLRQRQQDIKTSINTEAGELRLLAAFVDAFAPSSAQDQCRTYLVQYTSRLIAESLPTTRYNNLQAAGGESELNGFLSTLIKADAKDVRDDVRAQAYGAVTRLTTERSTRISIL